jgi:hypothetical protein
MGKCRLHGSCDEDAGETEKVVSELDSGLD